MSLLDTTDKEGPLDLKTNSKQLASYLTAGMQLIPLHHHTFEDEFKGKKRKRGKSPVHGAWMKKDL